VSRTGIDLRSLAAACRQDPEGAADLARALAPIIFSHAAGAVAPSSEPYSTRREGPRPPEFAARHRAFRDLVPQMPGATKCGRWYRVSRADYESWRAARSQTPAAPTAVAKSVDKPWSPEDLAADLGLRVVKGGAR
jgi:hypothetical protein